MHFEEILLANDSKVPPDFEKFWLTDRNPLSGRTKRRLLANPNESMRFIHATLIKYIRSLWIPMPNSTSCRKKSSALNNLRRHIGNRFFYILDLRDAYGSVRLQHLAFILCYFDEGNDLFNVTDFLRRFVISESGTGLIVGAPASPDLFNLYGEVTIDRYLRTIASRYHLTYTRYLDDLTFSGKWPIGHKKRVEIRRVIESAGFVINHRKSQVLDLNKGPITLNGIGLIREGRTFLPRKGLHALKGMLHRALTYDDIAPAKIHGHMGMFWHLTPPPRDMNRAEQKVLAMYQEFQERKNKKQKAIG